MKRKLIFVIGAAGSGKSTIAKIIANQLKCVYLDKENLTGKFVERVLDATYHDPNDRESDFYLRNVRPVEYETIVRVAMENLSVGMNVVLSAAFLEEVKDPLWLEKLIKKYGEILNDVSIFVVMVRTSRGVERERLIKRSATKDSWRLKNWDAYSKRLSDYRVGWRMGPYQMREFDNNDNNRSKMQEQLTLLLNWLNATR